MQETRNLMKITSRIGVINVVVPFQYLMISLVLLIMSLNDCEEELNHA